MNAKIIDGKALAQSVRAGLKEKVEQFKLSSRAPGLTVILVGDNPASQVYVRNKIKACTDVGITSKLEKLPAETSEAELLALLEKLNADDSVDGILVQLPLPRHINAHALVIGRSNIVGKPMAIMLLEKNATVTVAHSKTKNLKELALQADVIVAAVGKESVVTADMVKPGAAVIDVGMNRNAEGKLCGDVDTEEVAKVAGYISPVPGGVGPMTIAMLLSNTVEAYEKRLQKISR